MVFALKDGCTISSSGAVAMTLMGCRSSNVRYGSVALYRVSLIASGVEVSISV